MTLAHWPQYVMGAAFALRVTFGALRAGGAVNALGLTLSYVTDALILHCGGFW